MKNFNELQTEKKIIKIQRKVSFLQKFRILPSLTQVYQLPVVCFTLVSLATVIDQNDRCCSV